MSGDGDLVLGGDGALVVGELSTGAGTGLGREAMKSKNKFLPLPRAAPGKVLNADTSDGITGCLGGGYGVDLVAEGEGAGLLWRGLGRSAGGSLSEGHTSPVIPKSEYPFNVGGFGSGQSGHSN